MTEKSQKRSNLSITSIFFNQKLYHMVSLQKLFKQKM